VLSVVAVDKPDAPENLTMKDCTKKSVTLTWTAPPSDGGAPITQYVVERWRTSKRAWTAAGHAPADRLELTIDGLVEGQAYWFRVAAENSSGVGKFTEMQKPVSTRIQLGQSSPDISVAQSFKMGTLLQELSCRREKASWLCEIICYVQWCGRPT